MASTIGTIVALILLLNIRNTLAASRLYFSKCGSNGFTCFTNLNKKLDLTYECPKGVEAIIYLNQFAAPANIENLKILNCKSLTISTRCANERKLIQKLQVLNIGHLIIPRLPSTPMVAPTVIFENISRIDVIPTDTFAQIDKSFYTSTCIVQPVDFQNIYFKNVTIDTVQSNAFVGMNAFKNFSFINVNIKRIQTGGIQLRHDLSGAFEMRHCVVEALEYLAIQTYAKRCIFSDNNFTEISSSGINATTEEFYFTKNFVGTLQPHGFSVLATNVFVLDNDFLHLKGAALEKISPGLIQDSGRNFGKLKFIYDFSKNSLNFLDVGSLHPDYSSYENVQTEMMFSRNKFLCSCENVGWLFSALGHGPNTAQFETFYDMVLDDSFGNVCDKSYGKPCHLTVRAVRQMIECGKCLPNVTLDTICDKISEIPAPTTVSFNVTLIPEESVPEEPLSPMNYTLSSAIAKCLGNVYLSLVCILIITEVFSFL